MSTRVALYNEAWQVSGLWGLGGRRCFKGAIRCVPPSQENRSLNQVRTRGLFTQGEIQIVDVLDWQERQLLSERKFREE